jgi:type VI secretion system protein VasD
MKLTWEIWGRRGERAEGAREGRHPRGSGIARHVLLIGAAFVLAACSSVTAVHIVGAAVTAAMETAGLKEPAGAGEDRMYRPLTLTLAAGELLNATTAGESLALVVQIYQLRDGTAFSTLSYAQAVNADNARAVLGEDLVALRELTLRPGETYRFGEPVGSEVRVVGIVALFRAPAPNRWKLAFDREASAGEGIAVGFHACAMTIGTGELANRGATVASRTLGGVHCNQI